MLQDNYILSSLYLIGMPSYVVDNILIINQLYNVLIFTLKSEVVLTSQLIFFRIYPNDFSELFNIFKIISN